jgi:predicted NBD/HSP70 family sugar kinase
MLDAQIRWNEKEKCALAPVIGIGCPGIIREDGSIDRGGQNLPGNWESGGFHLPGSIKEKIQDISGSETMIVMHNDAVVQGLSELPRMQDRENWAVLTIGTGLGNARFTNRDVKKQR